jgi:CSLREA domain-containing protein
MWLLRFALIVTLVFLPAGSFQASIFTVTKIQDTADSVCDADCSLREALVAANGNAGSDDVAVPAGTYLLVGPHISIEDDVSITGDGQLATVIDGANFRGVFQVLPGVTAAISDVTIQNGNAYTGGGALFNRGTLTLTDTTLYSNHARDRGGAIWNTGGAMVTLTNSTVDMNTVLFFDGGGIYNDATSTVALVNSTLSGNGANDGAGVYNLGVLSITNSTLSGNIALADGGAIYNSSTGDVTITDSTISGNGASLYGGGAYNYGNLDIVGSTLSDNTAAFGGGIDNEGAATLTNSTLSGNVATSGGAVYSTDDLDVLNTTVSGNTADYGSAFYTGYLGGAVKMEIANSIVSDNGPGASCDGDLLDSTGYNLADDASCLFAQVGDLVVADAKVGPLANNGGPTETRDLQPDSPAIDTANPASCPATDQRGEARPFDGDDNGSAVCDIGAVEFVPEPDGWLMLLFGSCFLAGVSRRRPQRPYGMGGAPVN